MKDQRLIRFAKQLVHYSCAVKPGDKVLIEDRGLAPELDTALVEAVYQAGGIPVVQLFDHKIERALLLGCSKEQLEWMAEKDSARMSDCQAYIGIRGGHNIYENADVPAEKLSLYAVHYNNLVHGEIRIPKTRWVVLRYPTSSMAQLAGMSTEGFEDFYFDVCLMDYGKMSRAMDPLVDRMMKTDRVKITGPGTDISFSINGQPAIKCDGKVNIPDGEVFSAPVRTSVNGVISYNTPSMYQGLVHENITFTFKDGKIIKASGSMTI